MKISILETLNNEIKEHDAFNNLNRYFKYENYLFLFVKQMDFLLKNAKSIEALIKIRNIYDAYTIYRKFLETFFLLMFVVEHPEASEDAFKHNRLISDKVTGNNKDEIKRLRKTEIDGFVEYGFILPYINTTGKDKIVIRDVANAAKCGQYFIQYKVCNNFVHNNLNYVNVDLMQIKETLIKSFNDISSYIFNKITAIIYKK